MKNFQIIRVGYISGAIADAVVGLILVFLPGFVISHYGMNMEMNDGIAFWVRYTGVIIFMWTGILIWANKMPVERKIIALLTLFVVLGFMLVEIFGTITGVVPLTNIIPLLFLQVILVLIFGIGYWKAK